MSNKIYELYKKYQENPLDNNFINKAFENMLEEENELIPYIKDFKINNNSNRLLGSYSNEERIITINKDLIEKQPYNHQLYALHIIKHELEHARNLRTLYKGKEDIESTIIYYSLRSYAMEHNIDYYPNLDNLDKGLLDIGITINYQYDPGERLADIKASKYIVNLIKNERNTTDLLFARMMLYYAYTRGYKNNGYYLDPPTYEFLLKTGMFHNHYWLKNRVNKKNYSLNTRITYGLPITYKEFNNDIPQKVKVYKKRHD